MASIIYKGTNGVGGGSGNTIYAFSDGAYTWQTIAADTTAQDNYAYLVDNPDPVVISPPNSPNVGDTFLAMSINGVVAFDFKINGEYNADILKAIKIESINTPFRFFYTGTTYGWACENANEFGYYSTSDPYFNNVVLFIKGDGVNGSTAIVDESPTPKTITVNGGAQISTTQSKYGGSSIFFDGASAYLSVLDSSNLDFGVNDFCVETWSYFTNSTANTIIDFRGDGVSGGYFAMTYVSGSINLFVNSENKIQFAANLVNSWHHLAMCRFGGTTTLYVDGVANATWADSTSYLVSADRPLIGRRGFSVGNYLAGYLDSFRITKGNSRYTANFNPETDTYLAY